MEEETLDTIGQEFDIEESAELDMDDETEEETVESPNIVSTFLDNLKANNGRI